MRPIMLLLGFAVVGCSPKVVTMGVPRPAVVRDVEGYAIASCLVSQAQPYLKDQGDAWASVIIQRMKGDLEVLTALAEQVKQESVQGEMAVIRDESAPGKDKELPVLYCGEIIDKPAVRAAIQNAVSALSTAYPSR